jgi:hypothetical protein
MPKNKIVDDKLDNFTSGKMPYLSLTCLTWFRDSYGLFDYDSSRVAECSAKFYDSFHLNRIGDVLE